MTSFPVLRPSQRGHGELCSDSSTLINGVDVTWRHMELMWKWRTAWIYLQSLFSFVCTPCNLGSSSCEHYLIHPIALNSSHLCTGQTDQEKQTGGLPITQYPWRALPWIPQRSCGNRFCKTVLRKVKDLCLATGYVKLCLLINAVITTLQ